MSPADNMSTVRIKVRVRISSNPSPNPNPNPNPYPNIIQILTLRFRIILNLRAIDISGLT